MERDIPRDRRAILVRSEAARALELAVATVLFVVTLPAMAVLTVIVVLTSGWPPFYATTRVDGRGRVVRLWKFRTMSCATPRDGSEPNTLASEDGRRLVEPRITSFGRFLRATRLDGLPQLWSVIRYEDALRYMRGRAGGG